MTMSNYQKKRIYEFARDAAWAIDTGARSEIVEGLVGLVESQLARSMSKESGLTDVAWGLVHECGRTQSDQEPTPIGDD